MRNMEFKAGTYYVGDLCYILNDVWDEVCAHFGDEVFTLNDGRKCAILGTKYGDGSYFDQDGDEYWVDSGTIGCIEYSGRACNAVDKGGAHIVTFYEDFDVDNVDGIIMIGNLIINTDD